MGDSGSGRGDKPVAATRARTALRDGNFALARSLAKAVLSDAAASARDKDEAQQVLSATRIDRAPVIVGVVIFVVLAALFSYFLTRGQG